MALKENNVLIKLPYRVKALAVPIDLIDKIVYYAEKDYTLSRRDGSYHSKHYSDQLIHNTQDCELVLFPDEDQKAINHQTANYETDLADAVAADKAETEAQEKADAIKAAQARTKENGEDTHPES